MKYRALLRVFQRHGVTFIRHGRGDHEIWGVGECSTTVVRANEIAPGTLRNIQRDLAPCLGEGWLDR